MLEWLVSCSHSSSHRRMRRNQEDGLDLRRERFLAVRLGFFFLFFLALEQIFSQQLAVIEGSAWRVYFSTSDSEHFGCYCIAAAAKRNAMFGSRCFQFLWYAENSGCRKLRTCCIVLGFASARLVEESSRIACGFKMDLFRRRTIHLRVKRKKKKTEGATPELRLCPPVFSASRLVADAQVPAEHFRWQIVRKSPKVKNGVSF